MCKVVVCSDYRFKHFTNRFTSVGYATSSTIHIHEIGTQFLHTLCSNIINTIFIDCGNDIIKFIQFASTYTTPNPILVITISTNKDIIETIDNFYHYNIKIKNIPYL